MIQTKQLKFAVAFIGLFIFTMSCNQPPTDKTSEAKLESIQTMTKADPAKLKEEIQALETFWANGDNARDVNALAVLYADDASPRFVSSRTARSIKKGETKDM